MNGENVNQDGIVCPACEAQLVGVTSCPDPGSHVAAKQQSSTSSLPLYGGQQPPYRSCYEQDASGRAIITFKGRDGAVRRYPVLWGWRDPVTCVKYPYMIDQGVLEFDDLLCITGMGIHAFKAISAHLPGRIPGRYTVACETTQFVKEFIFGHLAETRRWSRVTRSQKAKRHRPDCPVGCRKWHRRDRNDT